MDFDGPNAYTGCLIIVANSPQLQQLQQQQQIINQQRQQQAARQQALMSQQYSGMPMGVGVPNGMGQMTPAQFAALRSGPMARSVNLPQHLQQAQQQAQVSVHFPRIPRV